MIYYWLHTLYIFIGSKFFWSKVDLTANLTRKRRVNILDCETLRYMNNSKYFNYMDFIRFEIMFRTTLFDNTVKKGIFPVVGSQKIIYKKPLKRWSSFNITLVLEGWDDKWIYHRQIFEQKDEICAIGYTKITFWKDKKAQNTSAILKACGVRNSEMIPAQDVLNLFSSDQQLIKPAQTL